MYSNNDFRSYQELYHAEEKKKKWDWLPGGKNTPEYNHWYYMTHPEKWGITKAGQQALDAAGNAINKFTDWTETDLDNKAVDAISKGYNKAKTAVTSTNAYKNAKSAYGDVRKATEAMQRRDDATRRANDYSNRASKSFREASDANLMAGASRRDAAMRELEGNHQAARAANRSSVAYSSRSANANKQADRYNRFADYNQRQAAQESSRANGYLDRAKNTVTNAARNAVGNTIDSARNANKAIGDAVQTKFENARNTDTMADDFAWRALQRAGRGDLKGAAESGAEAIRRGVKDANKAAGNAIQKKLEGSRDTDTMADDFAWRALQRAGQGDLRGAAESGAEAVRRGVKDASNAAGRKIKEAANSFINDSNTEVDNRLRDAYRTARDGNKASSREYLKSAARQAGREVGEAMGAAVEKVGNVVSRLKSAAGRSNETESNNVDKRVVSIRPNNRAPMTNASGIDSNPSTQARPQSDAAAKRASKAVRKAYDDAMEAVREAKERYGEGSLQYIQAVQDAFADAKKAISVSGDALRTKFDGATGTIDSAIDNGLEWLNGTYENMIEPIEYRTKLMRDTENYVGPLEDEERRRK